MLSDVETLRLLLVAVAGEVGALDEAGCAIFADLHFQSAVANFEHRDGDDFVLARAGGSAGCRRAATLKLLDAKRNPLFLDIDVEHDSLDRLALVVKIEGVLARQDRKSTRLNSSH